MTTTFPPKWLSGQPVALADWSIPCTIHQPPKITEFLVQRATQWIESDGKEPSEDEIYRRASALAWADTNRIDNARPIVIPATELAKAIFPSDNLDIKTSKSGRIEEQGKQDIPMACFVTWLSREEWEQYYPTPQDVGMQLKQYRKWSRHVSRINTVNAMAFDFDGIEEDEMESIFEAFKDLTYVAYSSFSHKAPHKGSKCCIRIVVATSRPMSPNDYNNARTRRGFWHQIQALYPNNDEQTKDPTRLWYLPSYRTDREEHFFVRTNEGSAIDVDAVLLDSPRQAELPMGSFPVRRSQAQQDTSSENDGMGGPPADPNDVVDEEAQQQQAAGATEYTVDYVKGDYDIRCHDDGMRTFRWIIENWDSLPKQANGNYNCCRPGSHTVGSAFINTYFDSVCELRRFRMTSVPSQAHWDCMESDHGITIRFDRRDRTSRRFSPNQTRQNVAKMVDVLVQERFIDIFSCARNHIGYVGPRRINDGFMFEIEEPIVQRWFYNGINPKIIKNGIEGYLHMKRHDALVEHLNGLKRDPNVDLDTVFIRYLNVEDTPLHRVMTRKWFIGAVARALHHGCQHDVVLILSGNQGVGKTTFWKTIAGRCKYTGRPYHKEGKVDINNKDSLLNFLQAWIFEWGELSGMNHKSKEDFKLLTSQQENTIRKAYGYFEDDILRKGVIVGSCNPDQNPLVDEENRRIWLMHCKTDSGNFSYTREDLAKEREAIWAEAVYLYKQGIKDYNEWGCPIYAEDLWWLSTEERQQHIKVNESMKDDDLHYNMFLRYVVDNPDAVKSGDDIIEDIYNEVYIDDRGEERKRSKVIKPPHKKEVSRILKKIGCKYKTVRVNGHPCKRWVLPRIEKDFDTICDYEVSVSKDIPKRKNIINVQKSGFMVPNLDPFSGFDVEDI